MQLIVPYPVNLLLNLGNVVCSDFSLESLIFLSLLGVLLRNFFHFVAAEVLVERLKEVGSNRRSRRRSSCCCQLLIIKGVSGATWTGLIRRFYCTIRGILNSGIELRRKRSKKEADDIGYINLVVTN